MARGRILGDESMTRLPPRTHASPMRGAPGDRIQLLAEPLLDRRFYRPNAPPILWKYAGKLPQPLTAVR